MAQVGRGRFALEQRNRFGERQDALAFLSQGAWAVNGCVPGTYEPVVLAGCVAASAGYFVPTVVASR